MSTPTGRPESVGSRHLARQAAVQMLYQWEVGRMGIGEAQQAWPSVEQDDVRLSDAQRVFANRLASGVAAKVSQIDPLISEAASTWRIERMPVIDRLILRLAVFEFLEERDTPATVIIDEAIELARAFSTDEAVGFVNGVLDAVRRRLERV